MRGALEGGTLPATYADLPEKDTRPRSLKHLKQGNSFVFVRHATPLDSASHCHQELSPVCQRCAQQASVEEEKYSKDGPLLQLGCLLSLSFRPRPIES